MRGNLYDGLVYEDRSHADWCVITLLGCGDYNLTFANYFCPKCEVGFAIGENTSYREMACRRCGNVMLKLAEIHDFKEWIKRPFDMVVRI
jgi:DNA-directed RNA polymerase subunit RPC12/RpoP